MIKGYGSTEGGRFPASQNTTIADHSQDVFKRLVRSEGNLQMDVTSQQHPFAKNPKYSRQYRGAYTVQM